MIASHRWISGNRAYEPSNLLQMQQLPRRVQIQFRSAYYYAGTATFDKKVADADLLPIPVRPTWCKDCEAVCLVEDIASLRAFEDAYGAVRCGRSIEYPVDSRNFDPQVVQEDVAHLLRWRMERVHRAGRYAAGDRIISLWTSRSHCSSTMAANSGLLNRESCLDLTTDPVQVYVAQPTSISTTKKEFWSECGRLTWWNQVENWWATESAEYDPIVED